LRRPARSIGVRILVALAALLSILALVVGYAERAVFNSDQFANRATSTLRDDSVRTLIADRITDELVLKKQSDLIAARPLIQSITSSIVGGRVFTGIFRKGVRDVHRALFKRDQHTLTLTVNDIGTVVAAALQVLQPSVAGKVKTNDVDLVTRDIGSVSAKTTRAADAVHFLGVILLVLTVGLCAVAIWISDDRRRTIGELGVGVACAGVLLVFVLAIAHSLAIDRIADPESRAAADSIWAAYVSDLTHAGWIVAGAGAIIAASAASMIRPIDIDEPLRRVGRAILRQPERPVLQVVRALGFVAAGLLCIFDRNAVIELIFTVVGVYLVYVGVSAILWLTYRPREKAVTAPRRARRRPLAVGVVAAVLIAVAVSVFVGTGGASEPAPAAGPCLGHEKLCDRPFDQVALAATHNSMSVPLPGWYSALQDRPIAEQLNDGIRGLLIDTHYADRLGNNRLRTDVGSPADLRAMAEHDGVSPDAVDAALRLRDRLGFEGSGERGMYLCHSFCELGGTPLEDVLDQIHDFLVANPSQIVVVINQDYVTPADFVGAVKKAGLADLTYRGPTSGRWPTVRQMIDRDQRVVFLAENHAGAAPWYHLAYKAITKETPYAFGKVSQLTDPAALAASCKPNRGPESASIFLVNHWITTDPLPLPSDAAKVNAYEPLMRRLNECRRIRHHIPNLVAVNFFRRGDLLRAVDKLNGVG
jgi:hypothetical protein